MSTIRGTNVIAPVVPFDTDDIYASHLAKYGQGGWRTAEDLNERDDIKELRRENLMVCAVTEDSYNNSTRGKAYYILDVNHDASTSTALLDNNNWIPLEFGGDSEHWVLPPPPRSFYPGNQGERSYDEDFIYICILDNVWKRVAFDFFEDGFDSTAGSTSGVLPNGVVPIWCDDDWCYEKVVSNIEGTAGAGTNSDNNLLVTFTDGEQKLIPIGELEHWVLPPPLTTLSPGKEGERSYDDNFLYVCIQDNVWKRVAYDFFVFGSGTSGSGGTFTIPTGAVPIWDNVIKDWNYDFVVEDVETTSGTAGNVLVTFTDKTQKILEIFSSSGGDNWILPPPISSASSGIEGQRSYDDDFLYICVQDNVWKRINLDLFLFSGGTNGNGGTSGLILPNGVVPIWNDVSEFFEYGVLVENVEVTGGQGTNFINITYSNNQSSSFEVVGGSGGGSSDVEFLDDLTDVSINTPSSNQYLRYTGSNWINDNLIIPDYTTAGLVFQTEFDSATSGINNSLDSLDNRVDSLENSMVNDYTTAGLVSQIDFDSATSGINTDLDSLQNQIDNLDIKDHTTAGYLTTYNDYTTAGLVSQIDFDSATSGINTDLDSLQNQIDNLDIKDHTTAGYLTTYNDYTTAGLASSSWVINNFVDNITFSNSTQGIIEQIEALASIDTLKAPDAYTANGSYPSTHFGQAIESGDTWRITNNGTMGVVVVNPEDLLIAITDNPLQNGSNFMVVESNRDQATEVFLGVSKIATSAEVTTGINDTSYVTPLKLENKLNSLPQTPDYTTAGLATTAYVDNADTNLQNQIDSLESATTGINNSLNSINDYVKYDAQTDSYFIEPTLDGQTQNLGQEIFFNAKNDNGTGANSLEPKLFLSFGSSTDEGYKSVYMASAKDLDFGYVFGLNTTSLLSGEKGKVATYGIVNDVNTSMWNENDTLYADTVEGELTNTKPLINAFVVGTVLESNSTAGQIYVNTLNAHRVDESEILVGVSQSFFTADDISTTSGVYYKNLIDNEGTNSVATETAIVPDDSIVALGKDHLSESFPIPRTIFKGLRDGQVEFEIDSLGGQEKIYLEVYLSDNDGTPIDSGIVSEAIGTLGVKPITVLETALLNVSSAGSIIKENFRGLLSEDFNLPTNHRLRFRFLCEKIGTSGGNKTFTIYFGSDHETFINTIVPFTSDDISNVSNVTGSNVSIALNNLDTDITNLQSQIDDSKLYTATETRTITSSGVVLTPTTLYSSTAGGSNIIPANSLAVGDTIKTKLKGYLNVSTTGVFAFDVQLGGTSLASVSSVVIASPKTNTLIELDFEFTVRSIGASGSVIGQGKINITLGSISTPAIATLVQTSTATINTTTNNLLDYLIDWDSGFSGNINITNATIEK